MKTIIVTGLSGAGKSQAMNCLEDLGYYCVDNMPPMLIDSFIKLTSEGSSQFEKAAFAIDIRTGDLFSDIEKSLDELAAKGIEYKILFLEASERVLIRRFNETRRKHPLAEDKNTVNGIRKEKELMQSLRDNFIGHERIHNLVSNKTPKYGNDDDYADAIMRNVFELYRKLVTDRPSMTDGKYRYFVE